MRNEPERIRDWRESRADVTAWKTLSASSALCCGWGAPANGIGLRMNVGDMSACAAGDRDRLEDPGEVGYSLLRARLASMGGRAGGGLDGLEARKDADFKRNGKERETGLGTAIQRGVQYPAGECHSQGPGRQAGLPRSRDRPGILATWGRHCRFRCGWRCATPRALGVCSLSSASLHSRTRPTVSALAADQPASSSENDPQVSQRVQSLTSLAISTASQVQNLSVKLLFR